MRTLVAAVYAALIVTLVAVPASADCRRAGHVYPTYSPPVVVAAPGYDVVRVQPVPFVVLPSTFYQVAPELVNARLIAIASEDAARRAVAEYAARYGPPPGPVQPVPVPVQPPPVPPAPPDTDPVPPLGSPKAVQAPPIPPAAGAAPAIPKAPNGSPLLVAQAMNAEACAKCHKPGGSRLVLDFGRLTRPQLLEVKHRLTTDNPKAAMPPPGDGRKPVPQEQLDAVDAILNAAPN